MLFEWYLQILQNVWKQTCCIAVRYKTEVNAVDMCVTIYLLAFHIWTKGQRSFTSKHGYNCHIYFEKGIPYYLEYYLEYLNISSGGHLIDPEILGLLRCTPMFPQPFPTKAHTSFFIHLKFSKMIYSFKAERAKKRERRRS